MEAIFNGFKRDHGSTSGTIFKRGAGRLITELVQALEQEHLKELHKAWNEVNLLRQELQKVAELMLGYLGREKKLQAMLETLIGNYTQATAQLHDNLPLFLGGGLEQFDAQRQVLANPIGNAEVELAKMRQLLSHDPMMPQPLQLRSRSASPTTSLSMMPAGRLGGLRCTGTRAPLVTNVEPVAASAVTSAARMTNLPNVLFNALDTNRDGVISRREFTRGLHQW